MIDKHNYVLSLAGDENFTFMQGRARKIRPPGEKYEIGKTVGAFFFFFSVSNPHFYIYYLNYVYRESHKNYLNKYLI